MNIRPEDPANQVPPNAEGNNAKHEIAAGANKIDFHLKKPKK